MKVNRTIYTYSVVGAEGKVVRLVEDDHGKVSAMGKAGVKLDGFTTFNISEMLIKIEKASGNKLELLHIRNDGEDTCKFK